MTEIALIVAGTVLGLGVIWAMMVAYLARKATQQMDQMDQGFERRRDEMLNRRSRR